jgi:hypothetical protein
MKAIGLEEAQSRIRLLGVHGVQNKAQTMLRMISIDISVGSYISSNSQCLRGFQRYLVASM